MYVHFLSCSSDPNTYLGNVVAGGSALKFQRHMAGPWETFDVIGPNTSLATPQLRSGDAITIRTITGLKYLRMVGNSVMSDGSNAIAPDTGWTIYKMTTGSLARMGTLIRDGDDVALKLGTMPVGGILSHHWLMAEGGGNAGAGLSQSYVTPREWETFKIFFARTVVSSNNRILLQDNATTNLEAEVTLDLSPTPGGTRLKFVRAPSPYSVPPPAKATPTLRQVDHPESANTTQVKFGVRLNTLPPYNRSHKSADWMVVPWTLEDPGVGLLLNIEAEYAKWDSGIHANAYATPDQHRVVWSGAANIGIHPGCGISGGIYEIEVLNKTSAGGYVRFGGATSMQLPRTGNEAIGASFKFTARNSASGTNNGVDVGISFKVWHRKNLTARKELQLTSYLWVN